MIISHKYKFIFIKSKKTSGTSLEIALSKFLGNKDIVTPLRSEEENIKNSVSQNCRKRINFKKRMREFNLFDIYYFLKKIKWISNIGLKEFSKTSVTMWPMKYYEHMPAKSVCDAIGDVIWNSYFKFSIERNPWDKAISHYYYRMSVNKSKKKLMTFEEFIKNGYTNLSCNYDLYSINGVPAMDHMILFENLREDLTAISKKLSLPENIYDAFKNIKAKSNIRKDNKKSLYNDELKKIIHYQSAREIYLFGYQFPERLY